MPSPISNHRFTGVPYVPSPNSGGALRPRFLVIHYTAGGPGLDTAAYFATRAAKASAHLVIRRDGSLIQCVPFNMRAWHAGRSRWTAADGKRYADLNYHSIGIELENWGALRKSGAGWLSWSGQDVDGAIVEARHRYGTPDCSWEAFTEMQVEAAVETARAICASYSIAEIVGHDDIAPGRKSDPGPAWDMEAFRCSVLADESVAQTEALT